MLHELIIGGGQVERLHGDERVRLALPRGSASQYADAQLDNYRGLRRARFPNWPPARVALRARASHPSPAGTLGFGFWNDPFSLSGGVLAAPNTVWFFYASPPSDMALVDGVPGRGWKAATLNAGHPPALLLAPAALAAIALARLPSLGLRVMDLARRAVRAHEAALDDIRLIDWNSYEIEWRADQATLRVNGVERLRSPAPPRGPLGFVMWIDNQYAIASRAGRFAFGLCQVPEPQWLEVEGLRLEGA